MKVIKILVCLLFFMPVPLFAGVEELEKIVDMQKDSVAETLEMCGKIKEAGDWYKKYTGDPRLMRLPLRPPVDNCVVTSENGLRRILRGSRNHMGVDLVDEQYRHKSGAPIHASGDGFVVFVGRKGGYGNFIAIMHTDRIVSRYGHLKDMYVEVGDYVKGGDVIATMGRSGVTTGPHLDYSIQYLKDGRWVFDDPAKWIQGYDEFEFKYPKKDRI